MYVVLLPQWADQYAIPMADGDTYEQALEHGKNALENYIQFAREVGRLLPQQRTFAG